MLRTITPAALLALVLLPLTPGGAASANTNAFGPVCEPQAYVKALTHYGCAASGDPHNAMDICIDFGAGKTLCQGCNAYHIKAALAGNRRYVWHGFTSCPDTCTASTDDCGDGGSGNYYRVDGTNSYSWYQMHANRGPNSQTQWCTPGCNFGWLGSTGARTVHVHMSNKRFGTNLTQWYNGTWGPAMSCGDRASCTDDVGNPRMQ